MKIHDTEVKIIMGTITDLKVDAIVSSGRGPADKRPGSVSYNPGGKLPAKYIIHAVIAGEDGKTDENSIRCACRNALQLAGELKVRSIAFPALGCAAAGLPVKASAKIMAQEILRYAREEKAGIPEIILCLLDKEAFDEFSRNVFGYLDYILNKLKSPFLTVDAIIEVEGGIVLIQRSNPPFGLALPGGFVDYGESLEKAVMREAKEETGLALLELKQFHTYSDPERDPRFHTVTTVFTARAQGSPRAGDDAASVKVVSLQEAETLDFAFNHKDVLRDYLCSKEGKDPFGH